MNFNPLIIMGFYGRFRQKKLDEMLVFPEPGYNSDLKRIAQSIMDGHDPAYNAPYH